MKEVDGLNEKMAWEWFLSDGDACRHRKGFGVGKVRDVVLKHLISMLIIVVLLLILFKLFI